METWSLDKVEEELGRLDLNHSTSHPSDFARTKNQTSSLPQQNCFPVSSSKISSTISPPVSQHLASKEEIRASSMSRNTSLYKDIGNLNTNVNETAAISSSKNFSYKNDNVNNFNSTEDFKYVPKTEHIKPEDNAIKYFNERYSRTGLNLMDKSSSRAGFPTGMKPQLSEKPRFNLETKNTRDVPDLIIGYRKEICEELPVPVSSPQNEISRPPLGRVLSVPFTLSPSHQPSRRVALAENSQPLKTSVGMQSERKSSVVATLLSTSLLPMMPLYPKEGDEIDESNSIDMKSAESKAGYANNSDVKDTRKNSISAMCKAEENQVSSAEKAVVTNYEIGKTNCSSSGTVGLKESYGNDAAAKMSTSFAGSHSELAGGCVNSSRPSPNAAISVTVGSTTSTQRIPVNASYPATETERLSRNLNTQPSNFSTFSRGQSSPLAVFSGLGGLNLPYDKVSPTVSSHLGVQKFEPRSHFDVSGTKSEVNSPSSTQNISLIRNTQVLDASNSPSSPSSDLHDSTISSPSPSIKFATKVCPSSPPTPCRPGSSASLRRGMSLVRSFKNSKDLFADESLEVEAANSNNQSDTSRYGLRTANDFDSQKIQSPNAIGQSNISMMAKSAAYDTSESCDRISANQKSANESPDKISSNQKSRLSDLRHSFHSKGGATPTLKNTCSSVENILNSFEDNENRSFSKNDYSALDEIGAEGNDSSLTRKALDDNIFNIHGDSLHLLSERLDRLTRSNDFLDKISTDGEMYDTTNPCNISSFNNTGLPNNGGFSRNRNYASLRVTGSNSNKVSKTSNICNETKNSNMSSNSQRVNECLENSKTQTLQDSARSTQTLPHRGRRAQSARPLGNHKLIQHQISLTNQYCANSSEELNKNIPNTRSYPVGQTGTAVNAFSISKGPILGSSGTGVLIDKEVEQIELFYKSQNTEVIVCRCLADLCFNNMSAEVSKLASSKPGVNEKEKKETETKTASQSSLDKLETKSSSSEPLEESLPEGWTVSTRGVPVLLLDSGDKRRLRQLSLVLAELGTGFTLWKDRINHLTEYHTTSPRFHSFHLATDHSSQAGLRFLDAETAARFYQALVERTAVDPSDPLLRISRGGKGQGGWSLRRSFRKLTREKKKGPTKADISAPCCFVHVTSVDRSGGVERSNQSNN